MQSVIFWYSFVLHTLYLEEKKSKKKISLCRFRVLMVAVKEISKCFGVKIWGFVDFLNW